MTFADLLSLSVNCAGIGSDTAAVLLLGDAADDLAGALCQADGASPAPTLVRLPAPATLYFGLPILTAPFPILVQSLMTERNTQFDQLSLFGWIEENGILEPRAEIIGLTPHGEQPVLFLRDLDLDRPPEAWLRAGQPARWLRVSGVALLDPAHTGAPLPLSGDEAALAAFTRVLPPDASQFISGLRADVAGGIPLRVALRQRRKTTAPEWMRLCDGWRVLSRAARFARINPAREPEAARAQIAQSFRLSLPRAW
ncbi:MAG: hypothetical protein ACUVRU_06170 [Anaerolineae bacterium]